MARNLLEKLSRQVQVMERLAAVSDENGGNVSSVVEGESGEATPVCIWQHSHPSAAVSALCSATDGEQKSAHRAGLSGGCPHS